MKWDKAAGRFGGGAYVLESTGRAITPNNGIIGLSPDGRMFEGYDNLSDEDHGYHDVVLPFTIAERQEIGRHMASLWLAWIDNPIEARR